MFTELKDKIIRKLAASFLLKKLDGRKTEIMRIVQAVNMLLVALVLACPSLPAINGMEACGLVGMINAKWIMLGTVLGHLGLELGIQDANAKDREKNKGL